MKRLTYIFLIFTGFLNGQQINPYHRDTSIHLLNGKVGEYIINDKFKISLLNKINTDPIKMLNNDGGYGKFIESLEEMNFVKYDFRVKIYLTHWLRLMCGVEAIGIDTDKYKYKIGIKIKF